MLTLVLALLTRRIIVSLLLGLLSAVLLLETDNLLNAPLSLLSRLWSTGTASGNREILLFSLLVGGLLALIRVSGGVPAFVAALNRRNLATNSRQATLGTSFLGLLIFMETNLSLLVCGLFAAPLFDRFGMSRARLAWVIDSTCSPVSVLVLFNGWGVYLLGLLQGYGLENPISTLFASVFFNFYAWLALLLVFTSCILGRVWFSLAREEAKTREPGMQADSTTGSGKSHWFWLPLLVMTVSIVVFMLISGGGNIVEGNGPASVLNALLSAIMVLAVMLIHSRQFRLLNLGSEFLVGVRQITPLVTIVLLAFTLGAVLRELGTGVYVASLIQASIPSLLLPSLVFIAAAFMSFATGTSWGTFALMIPVAIPVAATSGLPPSLLLAAVLSGGVWGDHCSPISDSTLLASLASGCDHMTHVRTQLPLALITGLCAMCLFLLSGVIVLV